MTRPTRFLSLLILLNVGSALGVCGCSTWASGPSERPGLGTAWGETRESDVHWVSFERDDAARPIAVSILGFGRKGLRESLARAAEFHSSPAGA